MRNPKFIIYETNYRAACCIGRGLKRWMMFLRWFITSSACRVDYSGKSANSFS